MESSPFVVFVNTESVIDLEIATLGNVAAAKVTAPPISRSRRVNSAIYLLHSALTTARVFIGPLRSRTSCLHEEGQNGRSPSTRSPREIRGGEAADCLE